MTVITHVPTLGDGYHPGNSSAIITVIRGLTRAYHDRGGSSRVLVSDRATNDASPEVEPRPFPAPARSLDAADRVATALVGRRPRYEFELARGLRGRDPGIVGPVLFHNQPAAADVARRVLSPNPVVAYLHNDVLGRLLGPARRRLMGRFDGIICVSNYLANLVETQLGKGAPAITVAHNGVDVDAYPPRRRRADEPTLRVGYLGRINHDKGPDVLLHAAGTLGDAARPVEFVVIGGSYHLRAETTRYERDLRRLARRSAVPVEMLGRRPATEVPGLLATLDVLVVPSRWAEPLGLVALEGAAAGLAVLGSRTGGIPEILDDDLLFTTADVAELADRLREYAASPGLLSRDQKKCQEIADARPWSRTLDPILAALAPS